MCGTSRLEPRPRVLVAEDDLLVRTWVSKVLAHEGMTVIEAENGAVASELLDASPVDVLITDLWMPEMNGVELIEYLNAMGPRTRDGHRVPEVIVLSAHLTGASTHKLRDLGVFGTLTKPADSDDLLAAVRAGLASDRTRRLTSRDDCEPSSESTPARAATVLVADDDEDVRRLLHRVLSAEGYRVVCAVDGDEAVEKALAHDIDLVVMDLNMPRMSGREAIRALKKASGDCFVIAVTGEAGRAEIDEAARAGAARTFRKPFDVDDFVEEVRRLDLIAAHRRRLAERERAREQMHRGLTLADRTYGWYARQQRRFRNRFKLVVAVVLLVALAAGLAVPLVAAWTAAAADAARSTADKLNDAAGAAARVEGYLQRDEAREIERMR